MSQTNYEKVREWNKTFGIAVYDSPQTHIFTDNPKFIEYRMSLIREEIKELQEAISDKDMKETLDALADILFVVHGMETSIGTPDTSDQFITITNMVNRTDQYQLNSPQFTTFNKTNYTNHIMTSLNKCLNNLELAVKSKNIDFVFIALQHMLQCVHKIGIGFGLNLDLAMDEVTQSNTSKSCATEQEANDTVTWYNANDPRYDSPAHRMSNGRWIVYNESTSKILKSINYKKVKEFPYFASIIAQSNAMAQMPTV